MRLRKNENLWQDQNSGSWYAELTLEYTDGSLERYSLGAFGSRKAASDAIYASRGGK